MNSWLANASIRRKLTLLMAASTTFGLLLATVALAAYEVTTFRRDMAKKLITIADIVGRNSTAALAFADRSVAKDVLQAFEAEPAIEAGTVFDADGRMFATYESPHPSASLPNAAGEMGTHFEGSSLVVVRPIVLDHEHVGTVYVRATLNELKMRMLVFSGVTLAIVIVASLLALAVSAGLQGRISAPILDLANTARRVTSEQNFSLRVSPAGRDEVGVLVEDFNRMLAEIEGQDRELRHQQEQLTVDVANRTAELVAANSQLTASVERAEHYADQITQLTELAQLLQTCLSTDEIFGVVNSAMRKLFPDGSGALTVLRASGNVMETMAVWGDDPPRERVFEPDECWAYRRGRPHVVQGRSSPLRCGHLMPGDGPVTFCVPMLAQGDIVGVLQFVFPVSDEPDVLEDSGTVRSIRGRLTVALAEHVGLALANLRLREALKSQSIVDPLTGLFNRRYLENVLERECRRAVRAERPLAVLMLDVDHFKRFNDTWGHEGGDAVLRELAALMRRHFRGDDMACRFGGEEFVVVLAEAELDDAFARAEAFRQEVHRLTAEYLRQPIGSITISIGLAGLPEHSTNPQDLISAADRALYVAKTSGRDRTVRAESRSASLSPAITPS